MYRATPTVHRLPRQGTILSLLDDVNDKIEKVRKKGNSSQRRAWLWQWRDRQKIMLEHARYATGMSADVYLVASILKMES